MRYLAPYREVTKDYAGQQRLDEAWVYGIIRQESRFIPNAKSSAGASGLMQLMPATARWVANKLGLKNFSGTQTTEVETNINLGTWYMKHVLDTLDNHPVLASAAYNAGPGRARAWRGEGPMEAAIYTESIPFNETRDYVKKGDEQRDLLRPAVRPHADVAQGASGRDCPAPARRRKTARRARRLKRGRRAGMTGPVGVSGP
jgi:soluble lytic murein transglycosylase